MTDVTPCTRPPTPSQSRLLALIRHHADKREPVPSPAAIAHRLGFYRDRTPDVNRVRLLINGLRRRGFLHDEGGGG